MKSLCKNKNGITLIELIIVLSILGIISLIAVPRFFTVRDNARRDVCKSNILELEYAYEIYLVQYDKSDTDINFDAFLEQYDQVICPEDGVISRVDAEIWCSVHIDEQDETEEEDGGVPFL